DRQRDAWRRYGANPLANAVSNMVSTATSEQAAIASDDRGGADRQRDAWRRYGANPLANAVSNMVSTATSEQAA
ncbi:hypothetical protein C9884_29125, partial [Klebsiella pneumoniae]